jgi:uncharacterized protein (DUF58 family)
MPQKVSAPFNGSSSVEPSVFSPSVTWLRALLSWPFGVFRSAKNAKPPVSTRFTREGWQVLFMAIFVLLGAILRDVNLLIILAGTLFATLLIQWRVCAKSLNGLSTYRRLPRSMHARRGFEIELVITNPKKWLGAWLVLAQDRMKYVSSDTASTRISQGISLLYQSITPNSTRTQRYRCVMERYGKYAFLGTELTTRFPFGLLRGILPHKGGDTFIVQPALGTLLPAWLELFGLKSYGAKQRQARSLSDEGDFFGLRAYRHGDSPRWIHWRSSARRNELVVKQFQQADSRELILLLDLFAEATSDQASGDLHQKNVELAVEFVATLVNHFAGSNFGLITVAIADAQPTVASRIQSRSQAAGLLDRLALSQNGGRKQMEIALNLLERDFRRVENLLVVSTRSKATLESQGKGDAGIVFWRSMIWLDASAGDLTRYFTPAE